MKEDRDFSRRKHVRPQKNRDNRKFKRQETSARGAAFEVLCGFFIKGKDLETLIDAFFNAKDAYSGEFLMSRQEKSLCYEIIYGILRNKSRLDFAIDKYLAEPVKKEERLRIILEIAAYQILFLTKIPDFAAVNESVNLCKKYGDTSKFADLSNAVLRKLAADKKNASEIPSGLPFDEKISLEYSHPLWLARKWIERYGKSGTQKIMEFDNAEPDIFVRRAVSTNKNRFEAQIAPNCRNNAQATGFNNLYYRLKPGERFEKSDLFQTGQCTIQSPSSGWAVALLGVENGKDVLDVCSAPGGKTALIAELAPDARILAADINFARARMVSDTLKRLFIKNVDAVVGDAVNLCANKSFDYVLADVPCSATGVINHHPEARWLRDAEAIKKAAVKQKLILGGAAKFVKVGGTLVYSTCSLEKEENREVVEDFLRQNDEFKLIPADTVVSDWQLLSDGGEFLEITPCKNSRDAIFAAKFQRVK